MAESPPMVLLRNTRSAPGASSTKKLSSTFTGEVWHDTAHRDADIFIGNVFFTPCARTHWHKHERGQLLRVVAGSGWICNKGNEPQRLSTGDVAWCPPGTIHWHGADDGSFMIHMAVSHGKTEWMDAVTDEEYNKKK